MLSAAMVLVGLFVAFAGMLIVSWVMVTTDPVDMNYVAFGLGLAAVGVFLTYREFR